MRWDTLDGKNAGIWRKPPSSTKQNRHHEVQLSAPVRQLLSRIQEGQADETFVFPDVRDPKRHWARLIKAAGIENLRIHDLRHSFASHLVSGGASLSLIGSMLGHSNPATTAQYSHMHSSPEREAAEKIGASIESAGRDVPDNLVPIRRRP